MGHTRTRLFRPRGAFVAVSAVAASVVLVNAGVAGASAAGNAVTDVTAQDSAAGSVCRKDASGSHAQVHRRDARTGDVT
jgi:hypothetical protein